MNKADGKLSRRGFLVNAGRAGLGAAAALGLPGPARRVFAQAADAPAEGKKARVVSIRSPQWRDEKLRVNDKLVKQMVHESVKRLTGKTDAGEAWKSLFSPTERVGVKYNICSRDYARVNAPVMQAILEGLQNAGVDRKRICAVEQGVRASFSGSFKPDLSKKKSVKFEHGETRLSPFLTDQIDCFINVPDLKHHHRSGVTNCLKNISHSHAIMEGPSRYHSTFCDPYIAEINALPDINKKRRLNLCLAFEVIFEDGPVPGKKKYRYDMNTLMAAEDPVALDRIGYLALKDIREKEGLSNQIFVPMCRHVSTAGKLGIGEDDPSRIELVEAVMG